MNFDALLVVSFGGPEKMDDVIPFLENVLRGRNVPKERMLEVAEHYYHFGGVSPINQQCRDLINALQAEFEVHNIQLPIYWGNRNWDPYLADTLKQMRADDIQQPLAFVTSGYSSYSGCRQYREDLQKACADIGWDIEIPKLRVFYNHPDFIAATSKCVSEALAKFPSDQRASAKVAFTAHSVPNSMSETSDYVQQLQETSRLVADACGIDESSWDLVYQSRSGPPHMPWLEPDILDHLRTLREGGCQNVVVAPIGFLSDHMEVLFDLDEEARQVCDEIGLEMQRAATVGTHPKFIGMIRQLVQERTHGSEQLAIGQFGPNHDTCPLDCCPAPQRPARPGRPTK